IPWDVKTWWNSIFDMLAMALQYHLAIDNIIANKSLKLQKLELNNNDWEIILDLICVMQHCFFSKDSTATVAHIIPMIDHIDTMVSDTGASALNPSGKHAPPFTHKLLDKYYSK
ncbi:hypothetical protein L208DRAFT_1347827, partial [Tricholoma matsutake]